MRSEAVREGLMEKRELARVFQYMDLDKRREKKIQA